MITTRIVSLLIVTALLSAALFGWQQSAPQQKRDEQTISVNVDLVNVLFTVADKRGKFIPELKRENFRVFEDGRPQTISNFSADTDLPLTVALLIDTSGSVRDRLHFEQQAAIEFFRSTLIRGKDRALLISFDSGVDLLQDFTDDPEQLAKSMANMRAGGGTSLFDAMYLAAKDKLAAHDGRRILVVITDGDDNSSRITLTESLESAQRNDVVIYAISTNAAGVGGNRSQRGDKTLKTFTDATGGRTFAPQKLEDLSANFRDIAAELRAQYALAYQSTNPLRNGAFRRIRVEPTDKRYVVRTRSGYYAPRKPADQ